jgi:hypothetical protein
MTLFEHRLAVLKDLSRLRWQRFLDAAEDLVASFKQSDSFSSPLRFALSSDGLSLSVFRTGRTSIMKLAANRRDYRLKEGRALFESMSFEEDFMIRCLLLAWMGAFSESEGFIEVDGSQAGWGLVSDYVHRMIGLEVDLASDERFTFNNRYRSPASSQDKKMFEDLLAGNLLVTWKPEHSLSWFF